MEISFLFDFTAMALYRRFIRLQTEAGYSGIRLHDLRHINASVMLALHVPEKYAMERGGWSSNKTLQTIYQHTYSDAENRLIMLLTVTLKILHMELHTIKNRPLQ